MTAQDVEQLKNASFTDSQITIATQVISYFNYINRIADGLGVDVEEFMKDIDESDWRKNKAKF